jgi:hypothetical protein
MYWRLLIIGLLFPVAVLAASLPRAFGKLHLGMSEAQITAATGADFSGWFASCPPGGNETSIGPEYFKWFSDVFPGLAPRKWMPKDAIVLLTTKKTLTGIVVHPEHSGPRILSILKKRLSEPFKLHSDGTVQWSDTTKLIECDTTTVRIYDRKLFLKH